MQCKVIFVCNAEHPSKPCTQARLVRNAGGQQSVHLNKQGERHDAEDWKSLPSQGKRTRLETSHSAESTWAC
jgi:hypothetical protein